MSITLSRAIISLDNMAQGDVIVDNVDDSVVDVNNVVKSNHIT